MLLRLPLHLLAAATCILAAPVHLIRRKVISYDAVPSAPQDVGDGIAGELYLKYKPYLEVYNGCVPFPAVDGLGNTGYVSILASPVTPIQLTTLSHKAAASTYEAPLTRAAPPPPVRSTPAAPPTMTPMP